MNWKYLIYYDLTYGGLIKRNFYDLDRKLRFLSTFYGFI